MVWAWIVGVVALLWFRDLTVGIVIALALVINLLAGAIAGTLLRPC